MEFVELVMLLIAVLLIWFKPEHEKLAWRLTIIGWLHSCTSVTCRRAFSASSTSNHRRSANG